MNEPTDFGEINEAISRRYGVQGRAVGTIASDAFPVFDVSDEHMDPELHFLARSKLVCHTETVAGLALNFSQVGLSNPVNSGVIAIVQGIQAAAGAAGQIQVALSGAAASVITVAAASAPRDTRFWSAVGTFQSSTLRCGAIQGAAAVGFPIWAVSTIGGTVEQLLPGPIILRPDTQLFIGSNVIATSIVASISWRERRINQWEAPRA